jgi:hypothetical protein
LDGWPVEQQHAAGNDRLHAIERNRWKDDDDEGADEDRRSR